MITICVEGLETYARLNYLRDKVMDLLDGEKWEDVQKEYMDEAKACPDYVLTLDEIKEIMKLAEK